MTSRRKRTDSLDSMSTIGRQSTIGRSFRKVTSVTCDSNYLKCHFQFNFIKTHSIYKKIIIVNFKKI